MEGKESVRVKVRREREKKKNGEREMGPGSSERGGQMQSLSGGQI